MNKILRGEKAQLETITGSSYYNYNTSIYGRDNMR